MAKFTYGVRVRTPYDDSDPEHVRRGTQAFRDSSGIKLLSNAFRTILAKVSAPKNSGSLSDLLKGTQVSEDQIFKKQVHAVTQKTQYNAGVFKERLFCYTGPRNDPLWMDVSSGEYLDRSVLVSLS